MFFENISPCVYAVGNDYQIVFVTNENGMASIDVGTRRFHDEWMGLRRSETRVHKIILPMYLLDKAGEYTVSFTPIKDRKPYFAETGETVTQTFPFRPVRSSGALNVYHIADSHSRYIEPAAAGHFFGEELDLLVLNGDISDCSDTENGILTILRLASEITGGSLPVVFARGNHDTRGHMAPELGKYMGTDGEKTYFTFRLGKIWGLVLDYGEDKWDHNKEYGGTICFEEFRRRQIDFLHKIISDRSTEYEASGVEHKLLICHMPFFADMKRCGESFGIYPEIFAKWAELVREIKPDIIMNGHMHETFVSYPGGNFDDRGQPCPAIIGSRYAGKDEAAKGFIGTAYTFSEGKIEAKFTDSEQKIIEAFEFACR